MTGNFGEALLRAAPHGTPLYIRSEKNGEPAFLWNDSDRMCEEFTGISAASLRKILSGDETEGQSEP